MIGWAAAALASGAVYIVGDLLWVTQMGPRLYRPAIGPVLADQFRLAPALVFYAVYVTGMLAFAVRPGLMAGDWTRALAWGALLGLVAYGTYNLTNQATLKVWSTGVTLLDMGWGMVITALASAAGCAVALLIARR